MRAVAVGLVVAYHLFPDGWLKGGFVGVDVFFVISGFLITILLLDETDASGTIRLADFWRRRARRLLPALALLVTVCASAAWLIGGDVLVRMGRQVLGAATFGYNWVTIAGGSDYFGQDTPELFRNLWSLAVEEQFYLLWPLVLPLFLLIPARAVRATVALVAAAGSAGWMAALVTGGGGLTRAYFGTDSHSFGLLVGVALAFALQRAYRHPARWMTRWPVLLITVPFGAAALGGLVVIAVVPAGTTAGTFPGALAAASLLAAAAVTIGAWPRSWFGRALDTQPLRWIGDRSYGIYLWHWPLLVLLTAWLLGTGPSVGVPAWLGGVALVLTLIAAELSYRLVERPVRRFGFRGSFARIGRSLAGVPARRSAALAGLACAAVIVGGTSAAIAAAPRVTSAQAVVDAGRQAVAQSATTPPPTPPVTLAPDATVTPGVAASPTPPTAQPIAGDTITAIGDSVMLASAPALLERFPGIYVDAAVSRSMYAAPGILQSLADAGTLRQYVVLALGTNGPINAAALAQAARIVGPDRHLVLVTAFAPRSWIPGVNAALTAFAAEHPGVVLADWSTAIAPHVDLLAGDHIHPGMSGGRVFAQALEGAITEAQLQAARAEYYEKLADYRHGLGLHLATPR